MATASSGFHALGDWMRQLQEKKKQEANAIPGAPQSTPYEYKPTSYQPIFQNTAKPVSYQSTAFKAPELQSTVQPAYNQMRNQVMTSGKQQMQTGLQMARDMMGRRNVEGGVATMAGNAAVDPAQRNTLAQMSELGLQEARDMSDLAKTQAGYDMQTQELNAGENKYQTQVQQYNSDMAQRKYEMENQLSNLDRQMDYEEWASGRKIDMAEREQRKQDILAQFQIDTALRNEEYQREMAPYQMLMQLYGVNAGQQQGSSSSGSGGILDMIGSGASTIAGLGSIFCLPKGTMIELESGAAIAVENITVGLKVKGGEVIARIQCKRHEDHMFSEHVFKSGTVIMTQGHPYFNELMQDPVPVTHDSECTYDILTDSGIYYVNGVKLGSTLARYT